MTYPTLPDWLTGIWRRLSIESAAGYDNTTEVIWLQTHACFGDLRIPAERPDLSQQALDRLSPSERLALAQQQGFAGITTLENSTSQWHRFIDYQPFTGARDIGLLYWEGDILIEEGVEASYREEWQRLDDGNGSLTALVLAAESTSSAWQGCLVTCGDYFIYARNRPLPLPPAESLAALLAAPDAELTTYLDCEISFGICRAGAVPWQIRRSTLPWREGQPLWLLKDLTVDLAAGEVIQQVAAPTPQANRWKIQEWGTGELFNQSI